MRAPRLPTVLVVMFSVSVLMACDESGDRPEAAGIPDPAVVELEAVGLTFEGPSEVAPGWTTIRLNNGESGLVHFAILQRLPDGRGIADQQAEIAPVFQQGMDLLNAGQPDSAMAVFGGLPEWFSDITFMGGPGLVAPGGIAETTVFLEPGTYLLECYVKTDGRFHSFHPDPATYGMVHELRVSGTATEAPAPEPTLELSISSSEGITRLGSASDADGPDVTPVPSGRHTVAVHFEDQAVYENFLGHDVHLVRLADDTSLEALGAWMDWSAPGGLETPAPAGFLGGTHEMPTGSTAYFHVDMEPGVYAWIAEVPDPDARRMLRTFTVR